MLFQAALPAQPASACPTCQGIAFWENLQSYQICSKCSPPPAEWLVKRRLEVIDGTLVDVTERDFRLRYPAETWDWREHLYDEDTKHLAAPLNQTPCVWCGRRGGAHSAPCGKLHDDWEIRIGFGKYKGQKLKTLPPDYLRFLLNWDKLHLELRREISRILGVPFKEPLHDGILTEQA